MDEVEAVARAICGASPVFKSGWDEQTPVEKAVWANVARAAIAALADALREQTDDIAEVREGKCCDGYEAQIAVLQQVIADLRATHAWRPIESAPRDGTEFDAWDGRARVPDVYWRERWVRDEYEIGYGFVAVPVQKITHWMPLPTPPGDTP